MNKKSITIVTLSVLLLAGIYYFTQRDNTSNKESQPNDEKTELVNLILQLSSNQGLTKDGLHSMSLIELQHITLDVIGSGTPYNKLMCETAESIFTQKYNPMPQPLLTLNYNDFNTLVDYETIRTQSANIGFACYPVVHNGERTFVVFKAKTDSIIGGCKDTILPLNNATNSVQYALLDPASPNGYQLISAATFVSLQNDYQNSTQYEGTPINQLYHPGGVFYNGDRLHEFYQDNNADATFKIEFANLSMAKAGANRSDLTQKMQLHSCILILRLGNGPRLLTEGPTSPLDFKDRAIDFGHLCPPQCD